MNVYAAGLLKKIIRTYIYTTLLYFTLEDYILGY
jgi:hypothetical protein